MSQRRYGTKFSRQGAMLIVDTATNAKLAMGAACTALNEKQAEIDRLKAELAEARKDTARLDWYEALANDESEGTLQRYMELCRSAEQIGLRCAIDAIADKEAKWLTE